MKTDSKINQLYRALSFRAEKLTPRQIAARYRVANPHDLVYRLRAEGFAVVSDKHVNYRGETVTRYSM